VIRYVIAVILTLAIIGISLPAVDQVAGDRSESRMRTIATTIEENAVELVRVEEPPPRGVRGPQRVVHVNFPGGGIAWKRVATFRLVPRPDRNVTVLTYRVEGRPRRSIVLDAVIVNENGNAVKLSSPSGSQSYRLRLARSEDGDPIVVFSRDLVNDPGEDWGA